MRYIYQEMKTMDYIFLTDASCDLTVEQVNEIGVDVIPMGFEMEGKSYLHYTDARLMSLDEFYSKIKQGVLSKTTQVNYEAFRNTFENYLKAGKDVIYTGISTGLSGTYNTCLIAVNELKEKYPERKIIAIDSWCDSAGLGFLVYLAGKKYAEGCTIEELQTYIEETRSKVCHWFIVEDLDQLKRGGRISAVTATFGKALQIKPLLGVDEVGHLFNAAKVRGKSNIIPTLVKHLEAEAEDLKNSLVFVAHADNKEGAEELKKTIKGKCKEVQICDIGPVIGTHVGSGMLAIIYLGDRIKDSQIYKK